MKYKKNLPNWLTILRILLAPVAIWLSVKGGNVEYVFGGVIFLVCCITDFLDGFLARRWGTTSKFGKTFDPIADKVLVIGCLIGFLINGHVIGWIAIALILRDVVMDVIRLCLYKKDRIVPAIFIAKAKTVLQMVGILIIFFFHHSGRNGWLISEHSMDWLIQIPLIIAVVFSWVSFSLYLRSITRK